MELKVKQDGPAGKEGICDRPCLAPLSGVIPLSWRKVTISLPLNPQEASGPYKEVHESLSVHNQPFLCGAPSPDRGRQDT